MCSLVSPRSLFRPSDTVNIPSPTASVDSALRNPLSYHVTCIGQSRGALAFHALSLSLAPYPTWLYSIDGQTDGLTDGRTDGHDGFVRRGTD